MLHHLNSNAELPERVAVLGAGGFVGAAISRRLKEKGANVLDLTRRDVDLQSDGAAGALASLLAPEDAVVCVSAIAPVKNVAHVEGQSHDHRNHGGCP